MGMGGAGPAGHQFDSHGATPVSVAGHQGMQHIRPEALRHSVLGGCEATRCMLLTCSNVRYLMIVALRVSVLLSVAAVRSTSFEVFALGYQCARQFVGLRLIVSCMAPVQAFMSEFCSSC